MRGSPRRMEPSSAFDQHMAHYTLSNSRRAPQLLAPRLRSRARDPQQKERPKSLPHDAGV